MSKNEAPAEYSDNVESLSTNGSCTQEAKRPISKKIATVKRLRDVERSLANTRQANKALRKAMQVKISIKHVEASSDSREEDGPFSRIFSRDGSGGNYPSTRLSISRPSQS